MTTIQFLVHCGATIIGDKLYLVGESKALGAWNVEDALQLQTGKEWPVWRGTVENSVEFEHGSEFKLVIHRESGLTEWCPNQFNHTIQVKGTSKLEVQLRWGSPELMCHDVSTSTIDEDEDDNLYLSDTECCETPVPYPEHDDNDDVSQGTGLDREPWYYLPSSSERTADAVFHTPKAIMGSDRLSAPDRFSNFASSSEDSSICSIIAGSPSQDYIYDCDVDLIGDGMSGNVYRATRIADRTPVAIKEISKLNQYNVLENIRRECSILQHLSSFRISIVQLIAIYEDASDVYLVMEWGRHGDLFSFLQQSHQDYFGENFLQSLFYSMIQSVQVCHTNQVVHRDLKPENFLLSYDTDIDGGLFASESDVSVKLIDFGLAEFCAPQMNMLSGLVGTCYYVAPEVVKYEYTREAYGSACDLWSLGCIMYLFMEGCPPFYSNDEDEIIHRSILNCEFPSQAARRTGNFSNYSSDLQDLVCSLLKKNPEQRLTAQEALDHPFFDPEGVTRLKSSGSASCGAAQIELETSAHYSTVMDSSV